MLLHTPKSDVKPKSLALFVHGFLGDHLTTWGELPEMLQEYAPSDPVLNGWDYLFIGYNTRKMASYLDIANLISSHWAMALKGYDPYVRTYSKLALFGHSLGTLGIRQFLCAKAIQPLDTLKKLHSVTLFGTPLNGSELSGLGARIIGGPIASALRPGNPQLNMLRQWNETVYPHFEWKEVQLVLGLEDKVVGTKYSGLVNFSGDAVPTLQFNFNHSELVKPADWHRSQICDLVRGALR